VKIKCPTDLRILTIQRIGSILRYRLWPESQSGLGCVRQKKSVLLDEDCADFTGHAPCSGLGADGLHYSLDLPLRRLHSVRTHEVLLVES